MAKKLSDLAARVKEEWDEETHQIYENAAAEFAAGLTERARLGSQLAEARKSQSLTQPVLSQLTGIQQAEISRIERGVGNPTAATLLKLAEALRLRITLEPIYD